MVQILKDGRGNLLGRIEDHCGILRAYDARNNYLGTYNATNNTTNNTTYNAQGGIVGQGNLLGMLLPGERK